LTNAQCNRADELDDFGQRVEVWAAFPRIRGDQLATMEAVYVSGGNAGPQNWTPYKEFDYTFTPNYGANTITLKPEFFAEVNDSSKVRLTLHFWSGTNVTYFVTPPHSSARRSYEPAGRVRATAAPCRWVLIGPFVTGLVVWRAPAWQAVSRPQPYSLASDVHDRLQGSAWPPWDD
jgi:hypothetical protein